MGGMVGRLFRSCLGTLKGSTQVSVPDLASTRSLSQQERRRVVIVVPARPSAIQPTRGVFDQGDYPGVHPSYDDAPDRGPSCRACGQPTTVFFNGGICQKCLPYFNAYKEGMEADFQFRFKAAPDHSLNPLERAIARNPTVDSMITTWAEHGITELEGWMSDK